jgi:hypothetical protein
MTTQANKTSAATVTPATAEAKRSYTGPFTAPVTGKITILEAQPKAASTKGGQRYALYRNGMTVQAYLDASVKAGNRLGLAKADVMWDFNHKFISIEGFKLEPLGAPVRGRQGAVKPEAESKPAKTKPASKSPAKGKGKAEPRPAA